MASDTHTSGPSLPAAVASAGFLDGLRSVAARCARYTWLLRGAVTLFCLLFLWVSFLNFPQTMPPDNVDGAWSQAYSHFYKQGRQVGVEYIQTGGPLMAFVTPAFDADLYWARFGCELALKLLVAGSLLLFLNRLSSLLHRVLVCFLVLLSTLQFGDYADSTTASILFLLFVLVSEEKGSKPLYLVLFSLYLALLSLTFFYFLLNAVVLLFFLTVILLKTRGWAVAAVPFVAYALAFLVLWIVLRQSPLNIPAHLYTSLQTTLGYSQAMQHPGMVEDLWLAGGIVLTLVAALVPLPLRAAWGPGGLLRDVRFLCTVAFLGFSLFLQWKHAFVRHDSRHAAEFFLFILPLPLLFPAIFPAFRWRAPARAAQLLAGTALSMLGIVLCVHGGDGTTQDEARPELRTLTDPLQDEARPEPHPFDRLRERLRVLFQSATYRKVLTDPFDRLRERLQNLLHPVTYRNQQFLFQMALQGKHNLPQIRARIGNEPVDLLQYELGMLFVNGFNWKPRPIFQSGSGYTKHLAGLNADYFRRGDGPRYLLFKLQPVDERLPTSEDAPALLEIFRLYRPVLSEKSFLLFERLPDAEAGDPLAAQTEFEGAIRFDEEVDLSEFADDNYTVAFHVKPSLWGRARQFAYKAPQVFIHITTADGKTHRCRLIPGLLESGALFNPFLKDQYDVINLYRPTPGRRVVAFRITSNDPTCYQDQIGFTLKSIPQLVAGKLSPREQSHLLYPMIDPPPERVESHLIYPYIEDGEEILVVHAEGKIHLAVREGARRIAGKFGILPGADELTDGVHFLVEYVRRDGRTVVLFERHLEPQTTAADRGRQSFFAELPREPGGRIILRTTNKPGRTTLHDFSYWGRVEIQ